MQEARHQYGHIKAHEREHQLRAIDLFDLELLNVTHDPLRSKSNFSSLITELEA